MPINILIALIPAVIGGLLVAIINHLFTRKKTKAETEKLKAETDKIRAEADKLKIEINKLNTSIEETKYYVSSSVEEKIIYDGTRGIEGYDFTGAGEVRDGYYYIYGDNNYTQLRKYRHNDNETDFLPKNELLSKPRKLRVSLDAKVNTGNCEILFIFKTLSTATLSVASIILDQIEWRKIELFFRVSPKEDCILWLQIPRFSENGVLQIRNFVLAEHSE